MQTITAHCVKLIEGNEVIQRILWSGGYEDRQKPGKLITANNRAIEDYTQQAKDLLKDDLKKYEHFLNSIRVSRHSRS